VIKFIEQSSLTNLGHWETFCRSTQAGRELTESLTAIAQRLKNINKPHCRALLVEALDANREFFYLSGQRFTTNLFSLLFDVDGPTAKTMLLDSFKRYHSRYPGQIIFNLDRLLVFADRFNEVDFPEYLYEENERYNQLLAAGLVEKNWDFGWIESFQTSPLDEQSFDISFDCSIILR